MFMGGGSVERGLSKDVGKGSGIRSCDYMSVSRSGRYSTQHWDSMHACFLVCSQLALANFIRMLG